MRIWQLLRMLESLDDTLACLYDCLRLRYGLDVEASALFSRLRDEKLAYRDLVRHQRRILFQSLANYADLKGHDHGGLDRTLCAIEHLIANAGRLTLEEALRSSMTLERESAAHHFLSTGGLFEPSLDALAASLRAADLAHCARIEAFARRRGITPGG